MTTSDETQGLPADVRDNPAARFGPYVRIEELGAGGFGSVWLAWDTKLQRRVALKILRGATKDDAARFEREARTAAALTHPNIAAVYDVGEVDGRFYIAFQYVPGRVVSDTRFTPTEALEIARDAARAVAYAHAQGVIHRDLKPQNLIRGDDGRVTVLDFGLAKSIAGGPQFQTASGVAMGTPSYMAPEQACGEPNDARTDVYGLGATLYEMVTGQPPFVGEMAVDVLRQVLDEEPPAPTKLNPRLDRDIETIVQKAMDKEPARRYATMDALAADLERKLAGDAIHAHPPSLLYRVGKRVAKRKGTYASAAAALAVILAVAGVAIAQAAKRRQEAERRQELELSVYPMIERAREKVRRAETMLFDPGFERDRWAATLDEAERICRDVMAQYADYAPAYLVLGLAHKERGDADAAIAAFGEAIARNPGYEQAYLERAEAYTEKILLAEHLALNREHTTGNEAEEAAWAAAARADLARVDLDAVEAGDRLEAEALGLMLEKRYDEALELARRHRLSRIAGEIHHRRAAYADAARAYADYADLRRGDAAAWSRTAHMLRDSAQHDRAIEAATRAIALRPEWVDAYRNRGYSRAQNEDLDGAHDDFTRALEFDSGDVESLTNRAVVSSFRGDYEAAIPDISRAIELRPDDAFAYCLRGAMRMQSRRSEDALPDLRRATELDPTYGEAWYNLATALIELGRTDGVVEAYTRAAECGVATPALHLNRGLMHFKLGGYEEALADFDRVLDLAPADSSQAQRAGIMIERTREAMRQRDF